MWDTLRGIIRPWIGGRVGWWSDRVQHKRLERLLSGGGREAVLRFARTLCRDAVSADDLAQEALLNAWRRLETLREDGAFRVWMHRVVYTTFLDRQDRERRHQRKVDAVSHEGTIEPLPFPTPIERLTAHELSDRLWQAIASLPPDQRQVVLLVDIEGFGFAQVAHVLEIKQGTVASRVARGRAALRAELWDVAAERGVIG